MKEILEQMALWQKELKVNDKIILEKFSIVSEPADASQLSIQKQLKRIESSVLDYYEAGNGIEIKWNAKDAKLVEQETTGAVKVNPFSNVVRDWNGVVFFDSEPADSARRKFFPLDFFADEAAAGFCTKEGWRNMMYLFQFEGELVPLQVDFKSYLQLLMQAKGVLYWQYLVREIIDEKENEVSVRIKQYLPAVFPDFSFEGFVKTFNDLRIK